MWYSMHMTSRNYPETPSEDDVRHFKTWLSSYRHTLPCCCCRAHFAQHVVEFQLDPAATGCAPTGHFADTRSFFHMVCELHNRVNASLSKALVSEADIEHMYDFYGSCRCGTAHQYGRAYVVVQVSDGCTKTEQDDSIVIRSALLKQACKQGSKQDTVSEQGGAGSKQDTGSKQGGASSKQDTGSKQGGAASKQGPKLARQAKPERLNPVRATTKKEARAHSKGKKRDGGAGGLRPGTRVRSSSKRSNRSHRSKRSKGSKGSNRSKGSTESKGSNRSKGSKGSTESN